MCVLACLCVFHVCVGVCGVMCVCVCDNAQALTLLSEKGRANEGMMVYGVGDGGGGPQRRHLEVRCSFLVHKCVRAQMCVPLSFFLSLSLSLSHTHTYTHTHTLSHTHTHSLSHKHTHTLSLFQ